jgi:hypothetical protein
MVAVGFNPRFAVRAYFLRPGTVRSMVGDGRLSVVATRRTEGLFGTVVRGLKPTATIGGRYATKWPQPGRFCAGQPQPGLRKSRQIGRKSAVGYVSFLFTSQGMTHGALTSTCGLSRYSAWHFCRVTILTCGANSSRARMVARFFAYYVGIKRAEKRGSSGYRCGAPFCVV